MLSEYVVRLCNSLLYWFIVGVFFVFDFYVCDVFLFFFFFFQAEDGIRDHCVTGVQTCALPIFEGDRATTLLPMAAGVALAEAIDAMTALRVDIKWPNDLVVARRKLGGILAEAVSAPLAPAACERLEPEAKLTPTGAARALNSVDTVVVGYGINVGPMAYPPELSEDRKSVV